MFTYYLVTVLIFIVCVLLILIVLVQNSKGGGLTSSFSSSNQVLGVKKTTDFLEKATWSLSVALLVLTLSTIFFIPKSESQMEQKSVQQIIEENDEAPALDFGPLTNDPALQSDAPQNATPPPADDAMQSEETE